MPAGRSDRPRRERERGQRAGGADAERLQLVGDARVEAQAADRHAADEAGRAVRVDHARRPGRALMAAARAVKRPGRRRSGPRAGAAFRPRAAGGRGRRACAAGVGAEQRMAGLERLDGGADRLQAASSSSAASATAPGSAVTSRIPGSERSPRRAHSGPHAEGGRGGVHLAHQRRAARLRASAVGTSPSEPPIATRSAKRGRARRPECGAFRQGLSSIGEHVFVCNGRDDTSGAQQPRLAPVLPPRLRQALTPGLRSARVTSALTFP
jgi:hypothetical protein